MLPGPQTQSKGVHRIDEIDPPEGGGKGFQRQVEPVPATEDDRAAFPAAQSGGMQDGVLGIRQMPGPILLAPVAARADGDAFTQISGAAGPARAGGEQVEQGFSQYAVVPPGAWGAR